MQQWWDALSQLYAMLQDSDALGLPREARRRLIVAIGALDKALLNCATVDCPIRSVVQETQAGGQEVGAGAAQTSAVTGRGEAGAAMQTCGSCRWWTRHRPAATAGEGVCLLTKTESRDPAGGAQAMPANTLARAAANDPQVGAVLLTQLPYGCSQWTPV